jgi:Zn-dependent peptidase ImmA (M78 family)
MHEFKHVLDHTTRDYLYHDRSFQTAHEQAERTADYFAACLLMPKRIVKSLWFKGPQRATPLAARLQVSPVAARYRLDQLGSSTVPVAAHGHRITCGPANPIDRRSCAPREGASDA